MAYLKRPAARSLRPLELRAPEPVAGPTGIVTRAPANDLARDLDGVDAAYIDPPYNNHSYFANYHVWETITRGDRPEPYGVARKRIDCRSTRSPFNSARGSWDTLADLIDMSSGVGGLDDWTEPGSLIKRFEQAAVGGGSLVDVVRSAPRTAAAGARFEPNRFSSTPVSSAWPRRSCGKSTGRTKT